MIKGKDQNHAGIQVRRIIEKDPEAFQHAVLKCSFGDGPRQWAGDIYRVGDLSSEVEKK